MYGAIRASRERAVALPVLQGHETVFAPATTSATSSQCRRARTRRCSASCAASRPFPSRGGGRVRTGRGRRHHDAAPLRPGVRRCVFHALRQPGPVPGGGFERPVPQMFGYHRAAEAAARLSPSWPKPRWKWAWSNRAAPRTRSQWCRPRRRAQAGRQRPRSLVERPLMKKGQQQWAAQQMAVEGQVFLRTAGRARLAAFMAKRLPDFSKIQE